MGFKDVKTFQTFSFTLINRNWGHLGCRYIAGVTSLKMEILHMFGLTKKLALLYKCYYPMSLTFLESPIVCEWVCVYVFWFQSGIRILLAYDYKLWTSLPCGYYFLPSSTGCHTDQGLPPGDLCIPSFMWLKLTISGFRMIRIPIAGPRPLLAEILISHDFCWNAGRCQSCSSEEVWWVQKFLVFHCLGLWFTALGGPAVQCPQ